MTRETPLKQSLMVDKPSGTVVVRNKVPNERILHMAMIMGIISPQQHDFLVSLGESKELELLLKDVAEQGLDMLVSMLKKLGKDRLIVIG